MKLYLKSYLTYLKELCIRPLNFVLFQELKKGSKSILVKEMLEVEIWPGGVWLLSDS